MKQKKLLFIRKNETSCEMLLEVCQLLVQACEIISDWLSVEKIKLAKEVKKDETKN